MSFGSTIPTTTFPWAPVNPFFNSNCAPTTSTSTTSTTTVPPPMCFSILTQSGIVYEQHPAFGNVIPINGKPAYVLNDGSQVLWDGVKWVYIQPGGSVIAQVLNQVGNFPVSDSITQWSPSCDTNLVPSICNSSLTECPQSICFKFKSDIIPIVRVNDNPEISLFNGKTWHIIDVNPDYFYVYWDPTYVAGPAWVVAYSTNPSATLPFANSDIWSYSLTPSAFPTDCVTLCPSSTVAWTNTGNEDAGWEFFAVNRGVCIPLSCDFTPIANEQPNPCSNSGGSVTVVGCNFGTITCTVIPPPQPTTTTSTTTVAPTTTTSSTTTEQPTTTTSTTTEEPTTTTSSTTSTTSTTTVNPCQCFTITNVAGAGVDIGIADLETYIGVPLTCLQTYLPFSSGGTIANTESTTVILTSAEASALDPSASWIISGPITCP